MAIKLQSSCRRTIEWKFIVIVIDHYGGEVMQKAPVGSDE
jgi:hypothetical protein